MSGFYVDNALNRRLGRVGKLYVSTVHSRSGASSSSSRVYVDNARNRRLGGVGLPHRSAAVKPGKKYRGHANEGIKRLKNWKPIRRDLPTKTPSKIELKPKKIIAFNELKLGEKIGIGGFADVHIATWKNKKVAVKKLRVQKVHQAKKKQFEDEVRIIANLSHPKIVKFYGACIMTPNLALVMEYFADGSLYDSLYSKKSSEEEHESKFEDETKYQFICDSFSALKYVHSKSMVHRDIKSKNIMLCHEKTRCKLADFGLALKDDTERNASSKKFSFAGTIKYCPEEAVEENRLTIKELKLVDVYSLALTSFELLTEREPFKQCRNVHQIRKAIIDGEILKTLAAEKNISAAEKELLKSALSSSRYRPSAAQFLKRFNKIIKGEK